jgi:hypothetical protein
MVGIIKENGARFVDRRPLVNVVNKQKGYELTRTPPPAAITFE